MNRQNNSIELGGNNEKFDVIAKEYDFNIGTMDFDSELKSDKKMVIEYDSNSIMKIIAKVGHADIAKVKNAKKKAVAKRLANNNQKDEAR